MWLSYTKRVANLIGDAAQASTPRKADRVARAANGGGEDSEPEARQGKELDAGAEVEVVLNYVAMQTDTSQTMPIYNCLSAMMMPTPADKRAAEETERVRYQVQLAPWVAKEMEELQEKEGHLVQELEKLQNLYADIERQQHSDKKQGRAVDRTKVAVQESTKADLKRRLHELRAVLEHVCTKIGALKSASDENRKCSEIKQITVNVLEGVWEVSVAYSGRLMGAVRQGCATGLCHRAHTYIHICIHTASSGPQGQ